MYLSKQISKSWLFLFHRILVGIRDFQTKSGKARRDRDGWTVCKQSWSINTVYHLLVKNNKGEGRLKWEGGALNFHPHKGGVIWEGGLNRGFKVNKIRSRGAERREEERGGDLLPCPTSPIPFMRFLRRLHLGSARSTWTELKRLLAMVGFYLKTKR